MKQPSCPNEYPCRSIVVALAAIALLWVVLIVSFCYLRGGR